MTRREPSCRATTIHAHAATARWRPGATDRGNSRRCPDFAREAGFAGPFVLIPESDGPGDEWSGPARMMTIADIYDALTASDRPYKRAVPTDVAVDTPRKEAAAGQIDADLLNLFVDQGVYEVVRLPRESPPPEVCEEPLLPAPAALSSSAVGETSR